MRKNSKGFTLMEIMIVIVIVSIMIGAVTLSFPNTSNDKLKEDAERFASLVSLAQDEAILQSRDIAIAIDDKGYRFLGRDDSNWVDFSGEPFAPRELTGFVRSELLLEGIAVKLKASSKTKPQIVLYSSGEMTAFSYSFGYPGKSSVTLTFDGGGSVKQDLKLEE